MGKVSWIVLLVFLSDVITAQQSNMVKVKRKPSEMIGSWQMKHPDPVVHGKDSVLLCFTLSKEHEISIKNYDSTIFTGIWTITTKKNREGLFYRLHLIDSSGGKGYIRITSIQENSFTFKLDRGSFEQAVQHPVKGDLYIYNSSTSIRALQLCSFHSISMGLKDVNNILLERVLE